MITTALQFSGGKDSRAVLHMYREQLDRIIVVWLNTGDVYPEMEEEMRKVAREVPHFLIVRGNQPEVIAEHGYPSDVVPIRYSPLGRLVVKSAERFKVQSAFDCCSRSMWQPLQNAMKLLGIKRIIRGQRRDEEYTNAFITNGSVVEGVEYVLPIENWTEGQVFAYFAESNLELPAYYGSETTSHDCMTCTAYLKHYTARIQNLPADKRAVVQLRLKEINEAIEAERAPMKALLEI